ncbi:MAG: DUF692 domain-containing protein [Bacteroidota bacterium]
MNRANKHIGIGFRKDFAEEFLEKKILTPAFVEVAPENWMGIGGYWKNIIDKVAEQYPIYMHGLSLSIGSPDPIDWNFLGRVKNFLKTYDIKIYSEHLSYTKCDNAHLYDLLPIPFRWDAVHHVSKRIREVQDFLERKIAIENVSYYTPVAAEMTEAEFINAVVAEADCNLLLDVNNIYVNAFNHKYNAEKFLDQLPLDRVEYIHMAGHEQVEPDLIIDTHGEPIIIPVYELFEYTVNKLPKNVPVLLERDFNIPELAELQHEMSLMENICRRAWNHEHAVA